MQIQFASQTFLNYIQNNTQNGQYFQELDYDIQKNIITILNNIRIYDQMFIKLLEILYVDFIPEDILKIIFTNKFKDYSLLKSFLLTNHQPLSLNMYQWILYLDPEYFQFILINIDHPYKKQLKELYEFLTI
jgi:hypothetical protein